MRERNGITPGKDRTKNVEQRSNDPIVGKTPFVSPYYIVSSNHDFLYKVTSWSPYIIIIVITTL